MLDLAIVNPEIPPNTGNMGRLTLGFNARLVIVGSPAFDLSTNSAMKRAGLDYWDDVNLVQFETWQSYSETVDGQIHLLTKHAENYLAGADIESNDSLVVGSETRGVPDKIHEDPSVQSWRLPMSDAIRSYNVANAAGMALYEAHTQSSPDGPC